MIVYSYIIGNNGKENGNYYLLQWGYIGFRVYRV